MLAIPDQLEITDDYRTGRLTRANDIKMAEELLIMLKNLEGIESYIKSDHIINLFPEVQGRLPEDKEKMTGVIESSGITSVNIDEVCDSLIKRYI